MLVTEDTNPTTPASWPSAAAEAARYALLRRLAPSIRHHLVVNLQPIGMVYEVLDRRLRAPEPDIAAVHDSAKKINSFARAALESCTDVVGWLSPDDKAAIAVHDAVRECAGLIASSLSFRGYTLRNEVGAMEGEIRRSCARFLLCATLIHATDEIAPPAELLLSAEPGGTGAQLTLGVRRMQGEEGFVQEPAYRPLRWDDVRALAQAEGAEATRDADGTIRLVLPWAD
ncbi:hypothetical protein [Ramlibacter albus]|uniref:Histidine kinase n=1 Tax=Ramlibacter albus TaxID=2079448 RepID=A0A923M7M0_9BURK|nr:hypothetical protein [Ramlibacter albus]MBC5764860.1 hypothetical protein [Ramlibacter albus]